jgi:hypothetical protein
MTEVAAQSDDNLLDRFQRAAFGYFIEQFKAENGLVADTSRAGAPASIAVVGLALTCYPIGAERGWLTRAAAAARVLVTLRFLWNSPQSEQPDATGYKGFFYHFLDMETGKRVWHSELSMIDTTLLLAGVLTASVYFGEDTPVENEIREHADMIYRRMDWRWALGGAATLRQGWKPTSGFLHYGWEGYSEAIILYVLALASPSHPLPDASFGAWTVTYQWENIYDYEFLYAGPLFIHHFSHAWIDFAGIRDRFMEEKDSDYFRAASRSGSAEGSFGSSATPRAACLSGPTMAQSIRARRSPPCPSRLSSPCRRYSTLVGAIPRWSGGRDCRAASIRLFWAPARQAGCPRVTSVLIRGCSS